MGTYGHLKLNKLHVLEFKNGVSGLALELFTEEDRREYERKASWWRPGDGEEHRYERAVEYSCSVKHAKARLEARGYSREAAQLAFKRGLEGLLDSETGGFWITHQNGSYEYDTQSAEAFVRDFSFDKLLDILRLLVRGRLRPWSFFEKAHKNPFVKFTLDYESSFFGFARVDPIHAFRALVEVCPRGTFRLDLSDLIREGYVPDDEALCPTAPKFFVLTEGSSDARMLSAALKARCPHMSPYYSFLDFETANLGGGAGQVVTIVKALAAARFPQRIIAILDNDAAAHDALRGLNVSLPPNIRILVLPMLPLAKKYPTIGPQGSVRIDINGLAVSLELFLGRNHLYDANKQLRPVIWSSFLPGVKRYQGEVSAKAEIQEAFLDSLSSRDRLVQQDWSALDMLFDNLFTSFSNTATSGFDPYGW